MATIKVRAPNHIGGTQSVTVRVNLFELASALFELVAKELNIPEVK